MADSDPNFSTASYCMIALYDSFLVLILLFLNSDHIKITSVNFRIEEEPRKYSITSHRAGV
jgi:hypothetical protein